MSIADPRVSITRRIVWVASSLALVACFDTRRGTVEDLSEDSADTTSDTADPTPDGTPELPTLPCECPVDQVYRNGPCVPTLALGCGPSCDATPCGPDFECDGCAAASSCGTRDCQAACAVPYGPHALVSEPLRITPTTLPAKQGGAITIEGTSFYIGALGHAFRLGDTSRFEYDSTSGSSCSAVLTISPDLKAGAHPLWVSQYSGGEPWVLAGVLHVVAEGQQPPSCVQPGFPCASSADCCIAPGLTLTCRDDRCQRR